MIKNKNYFKINKILKNYFEKINKKFHKTLILKDDIEKKKKEKLGHTHSNE